MKPHAVRWNGKRMLLVGLVAVLTYACSLVAAQSAYRVRIPLLQAAPAHVNCVTNEIRGECTLLLRSDYEALVRELKAACLGNGQTVADCQAE